MSESKEGLSQEELEALRQLKVKRMLEEPAFMRKGVLRWRREAEEDPAKAGGFHAPFDPTREPTVKFQNKDISAVHVLDRRVDWGGLKGTRKRQKDSWPNY